MTRAGECSKIAGAAAARSSQGTPTRIFASTVDPMTPAKEPSSSSKRRSEKREEAMAADPRRTVKAPIEIDPLDPREPRISCARPTGEK